jgi:hypothetical protein
VQLEVLTACRLEDPVLRLGDSGGLASDRALRGSRGRCEVIAEGTWSISRIGGQAADDHLRVCA